MGKKRGVCECDFLLRETALTVYRIGVKTEVAAAKDAVVGDGETARASRTKR